MAIDPDELRRLLAEAGYPIEDRQLEAISRDPNGLVSYGPQGGNVMGDPVLPYPIKSDVRVYQHGHTDSPTPPPPELPIPIQSDIKIYKQGEVPGTIEDVKQASKGYGSGQTTITQTTAPPPPGQSIPITVDVMKKPNAHGQEFPQDQKAGDDLVTAANVSSFQPNPPQIFGAGLGGGVAKIPAHSVPTVSQEVRDRLVHSQLVQLGAGQAQVDLEQAKMEEADRVAAERAQAMMEQQERQKEADEHRAAILRANQDEVEKNARKIAETQEDPDHYWKVRGVGGRVLGLLAVALSGLGQGLRGQGGNPAMDAIHREMEMDIASQRANIQSKHKGLEAQRGLLAQKMQLFGNERMAEIAARHEYMTALDAHLDAMAARNLENPVLQANTAKLRAQVADQSSKLFAQMEQWQPDKIVQVGGAPGQLPPGAGTLKGETLHLGGGLYVQVNGPVGNDLAKNMQATQNVINGLDGIKPLLAQRSRIAAVGGNLTDIDREIQGRLSFIIPQMSQSLGSGTPQEGEAQRFKDAISTQGFAAFIDPSNQSLLQAAGQTFRQIQQAQIQRTGGTMYNKVGSTRTKDGAWEDVYVPVGDTAARETGDKNVANQKTQAGPAPPSFKKDE